MHGRMTLGNRIRILMAAGACLMLTGILAVSYMSMDYEKEIIGSLSMKCVIDGREIAFGLWEDEENGIYYLFLPSALSGKSREFMLCYEDGTATFEIDGKPYKNGDIWTDSGSEELHGIELKGLFHSSHMTKAMRVLASEKMPAIMITAEDKEDILDSREFANRKYVETGDMVMLDESGRVVCEESLKRFKVRGNLTASLDKKPFTFTFQRPLGLCGMKPAVKWNLLANATDGSYIRNKLVLDLANACTDAYEPDGEFTELYLNGEYQGLYLLTEAVQIAENRLEISPVEGWFLEMELDFRKEEGTSYITTDRGQLFAVHSETEVTDAEKEQIAFMLNDIESALFAGDGVSALSGRTLPELTDLDSWVTAWLIQEISGDHDTGIASQFAYALNKENPVLYAGPVWDFDGTMGNVNTAMYKNPAALTTSIEQTRPEGNANQNRWLAAMYRNRDFRALVEEKYQSAFRENLEDLLNAGLNGYVEKINRSALMDAFRWHEKRLSWQFVLPEGLPELSGADNPGNDYSRFAALDVQVNMVREFLARKKDFLDRLWVEHRDFCVVEVRNEAPFLNQDYNQTLYNWVERGQPVEGLPCYETEEYRFLGYKNENGEIITDKMPVTRDMILSGEWAERWLSVE